MLRFAVDFMENLLILYGKITARSLADLVELHTAHDRDLFVLESGALATCIRFDGLRDMLGGDEFRRMCDDLSIKFGPSLNYGHHQMQFVFHKDAECIDEKIDIALGGAYVSCDALRLELKGLLASRRERLREYCHHEAVFVTLVTQPSNFTKPEKRSYKTKREERRTSRPPLLEAQQPDQVFKELVETHRAFVKTVVNDFRNAGAMMTIMDVHHALRELRMLIDPMHTSETWLPSLPGDPLPMCLPRHAARDLSDFFWPTIPSQLFPRGGDMIAADRLKIGDRIFSSVYLDLPPKHTQPFPTLLGRIPSHVPWRVGFMVDGIAMLAMNVKLFFATLMAASLAADNKLIKSSIDQLKAQVIAGEKANKMQICFVTWAPANDPDLLERRVASLVQAIQGWGDCEAREERGDPALGLISTLPGASMRNIGTAFAVPLAEALRLAPLVRPASPWSRGTVLFRTLDGKLWPYEPASPEQAVCIDIFTGKRRSGKSVAANIVNLGYVLRPGQTRLPYVGILDIGPTSEGFIALLSEALSPDDKHQVLHRRLQLTRDHAINVFDTQLGCREPLAHEKAFLTNFVTLLATPVGATHPYEGTAELISAVIDEAYKERADDRQPEEYTVGRQRDVDAAVEYARISLRPRMTWWEVADELAKCECWRESGLAQRYAVPVLNHIINVASNNEIVRQIHGTARVKTGELLIDAVLRLLTQAVKDYPNLAEPTCFDVSSARIVALDLAEVTPRGGAAADKQSAVMYLAARHALMNKLFLHPEHLREMKAPETYLRYHRDRIAELQESTKRVFYDELHRVNSPLVRAQIALDVREGGKANLHLGFASQEITDFDDWIISNATNVFIFHGGAKSSQDALIKRLNLTETHLLALERRVHGATPDGATFLLRFETRDGKHTQLLNLTAAPEELWALATTPADAALRRRLSGKLGADKARAILSRRFPKGTARDEIQQRLTTLDQPALFDDDAPLDVIEQLATELVTDARANEYAVH